MDVPLQVWSHQCRAEGKDCLLPLTGDAQCSPGHQGFLYSKYVLLNHVKHGVHQEPQVIFSQAAFNPSWLQHIWISTPGCSSPGAGLCTSLYHTACPCQFHHFSLVQSFLNCLYLCAITALIRVIHITILLSITMKNVSLFFSVMQSLGTESEICFVFYSDIFICLNTNKFPLL